jgi:ubiquinone biosynthesis protein
LIHVDIRTLASVGRFKDIVVILLRYGFDDLVERLDVPGAGLVKKIHKTDVTLGTPERIRRALEDLGPTFVKLGQMMSLRPDLLPDTFIRELAKLQDEVSPLDFSAIHDTVERTLRQPLEEVFSDFDPEPVAAASLAQVHRARLREGEQVVSVKVRRPGVRRTIEKDLDILDAIAKRLHERSREMRIYNLPNLVRETRRTFLREIDFAREAANIKVARAYRKDEKEIYIPEVYEHYCTEQLLVTEFIEGSKIKDLQPHQLADPRLLAMTGLHSAIKQILEDGFFHADPHPGNLLLSDDKGLCLIDWGMVGRLTDDDRYELFHLIRSAMQKDGVNLVDALISISTAQSDIDRRGLQRGLLEVLDYYGSLPLKDLNVGQLLLDVNGLLRDNRLQLPSDFVFMIRALVTAEGTARQIYPDLNVVTEAEGYVKELAARQLKPGILWRRLRSSVSQFISVQKQVPKRLAQIADKIERGELSIRFEHENLGGLRDTLESTFSHLTLGIIIGALIIGSSMIITTGVAPLLFGYPALGIVGYTISALLGLWLVFSIIRSGAKLSK